MDIKRLRGKYMKKTVSILLTLVLCCTVILAFPAPVKAAVPVTNEAELIAALGGTTDYDINVTADFDIAGDITITNGFTVTVSADLVVDTGASLTVASGGTLIIDGNAAASELGVYGTLSVESGGQLVNNRVFRIPIGTGVFVNNGTFTNTREFRNLGTTTNNGTIQNTATGEIIHYGTFNNNGTLNNDGKFENNGEYHEAGVFTGNAIAGNQPPVISTDLITFEIGTNSSQAITASNSPTTWSSQDLVPYGLSIDPSSGVVSGNPNNTYSGSHSVSIKAENAGGSHTKTITLIINDVATTGNLPPVIITGVIFFEMGVASSQTMDASNSPTSWSSQDLANLGLSIDKSGVVSGTPNNTSWGVHSVSIRAENAGGSHTKTITLIINDHLGIMVLSPFQAVTNNTVGVSAEIDVDYSLLDPTGGAGGVFDVATGRKLSPSTDYTSASGSTIITLTPAFLQTLPNGTYEFDVQFRDASRVRLQLVVNVPPIPPTPSTPYIITSPQTGDTSNIALWVTLAFVSFIGLTAVGIYANKKRREL